MIHKDCRGTVLVDVTSSYRMLAQVTQNKESDGLRTVEIHVYNIKETCSDLIFWCVSCDTEVTIDDVEVSCRNCGKPMSLEDSQVASDSGGVWCADCLEDRCDGEPCVSLESIYAHNSVSLT